MESVPSRRLLRYMARSGMTGRLDTTCIEASLAPMSSAMLKVLRVLAGTFFSTVTGVPPSIMYVTSQVAS